MTSVEDLMILSPRAQAERLAALLTRKGFNAMRLTTPDHDRHPCVALSWSPMPGKTVHSYIYVALDDDDVFWFWWDTLEPIIPAAYVDAAVDQIAARVSLRRLQVIPVQPV
jgi:hypothetical protein